MRCACRHLTVVLARSSASSRPGGGACVDTNIACVDAIRAHVCIDASTLSLTRRASNARHAICGTCMHAVHHRNRIDFAQRASAVFEMRVSSVIDTFNMSMRMCRAHRLRAYRRVEREKFARAVASTHRFFRHASRCSHVGAHDDAECAQGACVCSRCTRAQHRVLL